MTELVFNEQARTAIELAQDEAGARRHGYVGTEHLLAAIARERAGASHATLQALGVDLDAIRRLIDAMVPNGDDETVYGPVGRPFTSRGRKVLELALAEATAFGDGYIGSDHLLAGLLREEKGVGAQLLNHVGVTLERVRMQADHDRTVRGDA